MSTPGKLPRHALLALSLIATVPAVADEPYPFYDLNLTLETGYSGRGTKSIVIRPGPAASVQVTVDPNSCRLDTFGRPDICTRIGVQAIDTRLLIVDREVSGDVMSTLLSIENLPQYRVVITQAPQGASAKLLELDRGDVVRVRPMTIRF